MRKTWLVFAAVGGIVAAVCAAESAGLPQTWRSAGKAEIATAADGVITVKSPGRMGGITGSVKVAPQCRYAFACEVRGAGKAQCGVNGAFGWCYSPAATLSGEWQPCSVSYADSGSAVTFLVFSAASGATTYEVRNITVTPEPAVELADREVLDDGKGNLLVLLMNPGKAPRKFSFSLPGSWIDLRSGQKVGGTPAGTIPGREFAAFKTTAVRP